MQGQKKQKQTNNLRTNIVLFRSLDHAFSNYDERKTNEMHFQSKQQFQSGILIGVS
jgi:hypothetical protein